MVYESLGGCVLGRKMLAHRVRVGVARGGPLRRSQLLGWAVLVVSLDALVPAVRRVENRDEV